MAIEYNFSIASPLEPQQALALLVEEGSFRWLVQSRIPQISGFGLWISVIPTLQSAQEIYQESFGFCPTLNLNFRIRSADFDIAVGALYRAAGILLRHETGDAILEINNHITLQRIAGELLVDDDPTPERVAWIVGEINLPHRVVRIPQRLG